MSSLSILSHHRLKVLIPAFLACHEGRVGSASGKSRDSELLAVGNLAGEHRHSTYEVIGAGKYVKATVPKVDKQDPLMIHKGHN